MENLVAEFEKSKYIELTKLNENKKSKIYLVKDKKTNKIFIKKVLTNYNKKIYEILRDLNLKNVPKIYEIFEFCGKLMVIEEYINGDTLKDILDNCTIMEEERVIDYIISLCDTLNELHKLNPPLIHRDIKPSNIIISNDSVVKLIDFDVSREFKDNTNEDTLIQGTEKYAPPEQFGFIQTDRRSDIYSVGVLINVLITGEYPQNKISDGHLKNIIIKCTQFSPKDRYESVLVLKEELQNIKYKIYNSKSVKNEDKITKVIKNYNIKETIKEKNEKITLKNFYKVLPGFRTKKLSKMIIATLGYSFFIFGLFSGDSGEGVKHPHVESIGIVWFMLALTFLYTNFLNIKEKFPLLKSSNKSVNKFGYFVYTFLILISAGLFLELSKI